MSRAHSKSKACKDEMREGRSKSKVHKDEMRERRSKSKAHQDEKESHTRSPLLPTHSYEQLRVRNCHDAKHPVPSSTEQSKHEKLKEEVMKRVHEYICRHTFI